MTSCLKTFVFSFQKRFSKSSWTQSSLFENHWPRYVRPFLIRFVSFSLHTADLQICTDCIRWGYRCRHLHSVKSYCLMLLTFGAGCCSFDTLWSFLPCSFVAPRPFGSSERYCLHLNYFWNCCERNCFVFGCWSLRNESSQNSEADPASVGCFDAGFRLDLWP